MGIKEYASYDGLGLAALIKRKDVTPAELLETAFALADKHNGSLNAIVRRFDEKARTFAKAAAPDSPFAGVPFLLKDILGDLEGEVTAQGSRAFLGIPAPCDGELVRRFKAAGLVPFGKTNAPELGLLPTTEPVAYGPARNPWNLGRTTGGSSGGSAAAVAAGIVPLAHANDGGGSIRIPASACGLVGLKPTRGRNPLGPMLGDVMGGLVHEHVVTRSVRDSAAVLDATGYPDIGDPYIAPAKERSYMEEITRAPGRLRIAFSTSSSLGQPTAPECIAAVDATAKLLTGLGHEVVEGRPTPNPEALFMGFMAVWASGAVQVIDMVAQVTGQPPDERLYEPLTWGIYRFGKTIDGGAYLNAVAGLQQAARGIAAFFQDIDVLMTPTLGSAPIPLGLIDTSIADPIKGFEPVTAFASMTAEYNVTGQPAITLPLHWTGDGLPVGVQFAGRYGDEATLFRLAAQLEAAQPWASRRPPVFG